MSAHHVKRFHPELEPLEDRQAPAVLTVMPPGYESSLIAAGVADEAMHGLQTAQGHTNGVVIWSLTGPG